MIRFWYYAQVGIYVALAGLALGCMLTNGVWYGINYIKFGISRNTMFRQMCSRYFQ